MHAIGTSSRYCARKTASSSLSDALEDAGQRRDRADLDVRGRARQRAGVREAVEQRHDDLHQPWPHSSLFGLNGVPLLSARRSAMREHSRLSTAETNTIATTK